MKRKVSVILALALVLCMICSMFAFVACDEECTEHVDSDGDGKCDNCGICMTHKDADNDGKAITAASVYLTGTRTTTASATTAARA